jgi:hypothetical protein
MPAFMLSEPARVPRSLSMRVLLNPSPYTAQQDHMFRLFGSAALRATNALKQLSSSHADVKNERAIEDYIKAGHVVCNVFLHDVLHIVYSGQACTHPQCMHYIRHYTMLLEYAAYKKQVDALKHALYHAFMFIHLCYESSTHLRTNMTGHGTCADCFRPNHTHKTFCVPRAVFEAVLRKGQLQRPSCGNAAPVSVV